MKTIIQSFFEVFKILRRDKIIIFFSLLPILIGIVLFSTVGTYIFSDGLAFGEKLIGDYFSGDSWNSFIKYFLITLLTAGFYFSLSFGFVLIVTIVASPFNDIISERTERLIRGEESKELSSSIKRLISKFFITIVNEVKKISLILLLTLCALLMGFIPFLIPVGMLISSLLISITFLDYSWSRKSLNFRFCIKDVKRNFLVYALSGFFFFAAITIPLVNLFVLPFGVIYFTILYTRGEMNE